MLLDEQLVVALRSAANDLITRRSLRDMHQTLSLIVAAAAETVPGADAAGISMTRGGEVTSDHLTVETITKLDRLQGELGEGPCISAILEAPEDGVVVAHDLAGDDAERWPRFGPRAVEAGFRSMLSIQLCSARGARSALNLYASRPEVFDDDARITAGLFGVQAAMLIYGSEQACGLARALDSRDVIGQAKGILMERFTVDDEEAFQMLVHSSQDTNTKLVDVARWLRDEAIERRTRRDTADAHGVGRPARTVERGD